MAERLKIEVPNTRQAIAPASAQVEAWMVTHEVSPKTSYLVLVAIEELVTNCIEYGYDDAREHTIVLDLSIVDGMLSMTVTDDGHAFNPLAAPAPDVTLEAAQRKIGGLGIYMLRKMSDGMEYARLDGTNRVTLTKRIR